MHWSALIVSKEFILLSNRFCFCFNILFSSRLTERNRERNRTGGDNATGSVNYNNIFFILFHLQEKVQIDWRSLNFILFVTDILYCYMLSESMAPRTPFLLLSDALY
jgi:hypothetical protein